MNKLNEVSQWKEVGDGEAFVLNLKKQYQILLEAGDMSKAFAKIDDQYFTLRKLQYPKTTFLLESETTKMSISMGSNFWEDAGLVLLSSSGRQFTWQYRNIPVSDFTFFDEQGLEVMKFQPDSLKEGLPKVTFKESEEADYLLLLGTFFLLTNADGYWLNGNIESTPLLAEEGFQRSMMLS
ncbi:hypothetical protein V6R21_13740 [Limibacter armeniacum]|uniref:hypothetical protein n=1 Tax=Limibacter armeniacum TaxID=466084 RepID=UPI002FE6471B